MIIRDSMKLMMSKKRKWKCNLTKRIFSTIITKLHRKNETMMMRWMIMICFLNLLSRIEVSLDHQRVNKIFLSKSMKTWMRNRLKKSKFRKTLLVQINIHPSFLMVSMVIFQSHLLKKWFSSLILMKINSLKYQFLLMFISWINRNSITTDTKEIKIYRIRVLQI